MRARLVSRAPDAHIKTVRVKQRRTSSVSTVRDTSRKKCTRESRAPRDTGNYVCVSNASVVSISVGSRFSSVAIRIGRTLWTRRGSVRRRGVPRDGVQSTMQSAGASPADADADAGPAFERGPLRRIYADKAADKERHRSLPRHGPIFLPSPRRSGSFYVR